MFFHALWLTHKQSIACATIHLTLFFVFYDTISTECNITILLTALFWFHQELIANPANEAWFNWSHSMLLFEPPQFP